MDQYESLPDATDQIEWYLAVLAVLERLALSGAILERGLQICKHDFVIGL